MGYAYLYFAYVPQPAAGDVDWDNVMIWPCYGIGGYYFPDYADEDNVMDVLYANLDDILYDEENDE
jgi:hypothetical protein